MMDRQKIEEHIDSLCDRGVFSSKERAVLDAIREISREGLARRSDIVEVISAGLRNHCDSYVSSHVCKIRKKLKRHSFVRVVTNMSPTPRSEVPAERECHYTLVVPSWMGEVPVVEE